MEDKAPSSPPELLLKLNKQYLKYHTDLQEQQVRFKANPQAEQINVAFTKYVLPLVKKAAAKGLQKVNLDKNKINLDFIKANLQAFEDECGRHGLIVEIRVNPNWESELTSIAICGWAREIPVSKAQKHELTLTERIILLEERLRLMELKEK